MSIFSYLSKPRIIIIIRFFLVVAASSFGRVGSDFKIKFCCDGGLAQNSKKLLSVIRPQLMIRGFGQLLRIGIVGGEGGSGKVVFSSG